MTETSSTGRPWTVVVGMNGSRQSRTALRWAKEQAVLHDGRVIALRTWRTPAPSATPAGTTAARVGDSERTEADVHRDLAASVVDALGPDHGVELRVTRESRKKAFVTISSEVDLIVLGAPRRMATGPMLAHKLVYATHCPVVVMPPEPASGRTIRDSAARATRTVARAAVRSAGTAGRPGMPPRPPA